MAEGTRSSEPVHGALRPQPQRLEDRRHFLAIQGLLLKQRAHQVIEDIPVLVEDVKRLLVGVADQSETSSSTIAATSSE